MPSSTPGLPGRKTTTTMSTRWSFCLSFPVSSASSLAHYQKLCDALFEDLRPLCTRMVFNLHTRKSLIEGASNDHISPVLLRCFYVSGYVELQTARSARFLRSFRDFSQLQAVPLGASSKKMWAKHSQPSRLPGCLAGPWTLGHPSQPTADDTGMSIDVPRESLPRPAVCRTLFFK